MKWNEIPKFKEFGMSNSINLGFASYVDFIKEQIENYDLQLNPDFQRGHVWNKRQQEKYIEFIFRGGRTGRDFYFNWNRTTNEYVCVDGLQRTMAFIRFIDGNIKAFDQYFDDFCFPKRVVGGNPLLEFRLNVYINYLESTKEILEWYIDMNSGGIPHTDDEIERESQTNDTGIGEELGSKCLVLNEYYVGYISVY